MGADRRRPLPRPELERRGRLPGRRDRRGRARGARRALRGRARAAVRRPDQAGSPVDIRALRLAALGAAATRRSRSTAATAPAGGTSPADFGGARRRRAGASRARRSARRRSRARCSSTSTTRPSSSRPAGRRGATRPPERSMLERGADGGSARVDAITLQIVGNALAIGRRRDGDDDLPHRALDGRARRDGLLGRALRRERRDGRAGGHDPAPARLDPERDAHAARALRRAVPPRRRLHRQRPVRRREAHAGHLRRQAVPSPAS